MDEGSVLWKLKGLIICTIYALVAPVGAGLLQSDFGKVYSRCLCVFSVTFHFNSAGV